MKIIDRYLNNITMYRLVLYYLIALLTIAVGFSFFGMLPFNPVAIILSVGFLVLISWAVNNIFAYVFEAPVNVESVYITALILALIVTPLKGPSDIIFFGWVAVLAIASKFIIARNKKHLFNPAALAVIITAFTLNQAASWWVGTLVMAPFVLIGGLLIIRKIQRFDLVLSFFLTIAVTLLGFAVFTGLNLFSTAPRILLYSPLLFLAFVMLTEPLTTPPTKKLQIIYGSLVGFLFVPQVHLGSFYFTPELALIVGNIFAYAVSLKTKYYLKLQDRVQVADGIYEYIFPRMNLAFLPGQYLEWTLPHPNPDNRGDRRYFTIASSPTEKDLRIGVKFYSNSSSYKRTMNQLESDDKIFAGQLGGDFTLPRDKNKKIVFFAGGIGITPFRSMVKYLVDKEEKRSIVLLYSNRKYEDIAYRELFDQAKKAINLKTIYTITDLTDVPGDWSGQTGFFNIETIKTEIPDYLERVFYLSGPRSMVDTFKKSLKDIGVKNNQIKIDYFPGFA